MIFDTNWRATLRRSWTVRVNAIGAAIMLVLAFLPFDPVTMLGVWNMMPLDVRDRLPVEAVALIGGALFVLSGLARLRFKADDK